jgi:GT2 family glycosyltransferase
MLLDDDVELEREWVAELVRPLESDPVVGATMGALVNQRLETPSWFWRLYRRLAGGAHALDAGRLAGAALPNGFPETADGTLPAEWIGGGVAAVRRTAFESVGGFAPYFDGSSPGEDLDLGYRLSRHWKVLYVPSARAVHHSAASGRSSSAEYQYQSMRSRFAILLRAFRMSRVRALTQLVLWLLFQSVSELAAIRKGTTGNLFTVWSGRLRGVLTCLAWTPPENTDRPALFPRVAS